MSRPRIARATRALVGAAALLSVVLGLRPAAAADRHGEHVVLAGQTLWSIAYRYGIRVEELMRANQIADPTELRAGQTLLIPGVTAAVRAVPEAAPRSLRTELTWPVRGRITSRYGWRGRRRHTGVDIAATRGTIIVAADSGRVVRDGDRWGRYGKVVLIEHDSGHKTLYAHVERSFVGHGQQVERGQAIAAVGATGNATGPHLHFEIWRGDRTVDPLTALGPRRPRLAR